MPRLISSEWLSVDSPVRSFTIAVLPWSTWPTVPMFTEGWTGTFTEESPKRGRSNGSVDKRVCGRAPSGMLCMSSKPREESSRATPVFEVFVAVLLRKLLVLRSPSPVEQEHEAREGEVVQGEEDVAHREHAEREIDRMPDETIGAGAKQLPLLRHFAEHVLSCERGARGKQ